MATVGNGRDGGTHNKSPSAAFGSKAPIERPNHVLSNLSEETRESLSHTLEAVQLRESQVLYEEGAPIDRVYFPQSAVISIIQLMQEGSAAEIGMVGCEGLSGVEAILRGGPATGRHVCQVPGTAVSMPAAELRRRVKELDDLLQSLLHYVGGYAAMLAQLIACNRLHRVEQRCARWLLMTVDRTGRLEFPITQERLSMMLGAQRPTVTAVMTTLRDAECVENTRGQLRIRDRKCLESFACECYPVCKSYFSFDAAGSSDEL